ncbi:MAG: hypothetical protein L6R36_000264 [Xanthoria steineri]|nr:MAG: hypothetical protein L6R36_000264 [Xanthoria steineri]
MTTRERQKREYKIPALKQRRRPRIQIRHDGSTGEVGLIRTMNENTLAAATSFFDGPAPIIEQGYQALSCLCAAS